MSGKAEENFRDKNALRDRENQKAATSRTLQNMKRCPICNRVEPDDALVVCRTEGSEIVSESLLLEAGTARLGVDASRFQDLLTKVSFPR